ncbi:MAG TPA: hypothetical protein VFR88_08820 [Microlunatus sp.]|nr:hypothetical protein [Microlunatus sp.]
MRVLRIGLGAVGGLLLAYGGFRLLHGLPLPTLLVLGGWLLAALVIHHGLLSPAVLALGAALRRLPDRVRGYVQAALIMTAAVTVIALPLIIRQFSQPVAKAMLLQHYGANLALLIGVIALGTSIAYAIRVARDRQDRHTPSPREGGSGSGSAP